MKQKIIITIFFLLEIACSFLAWQSLYRAVFVPEASHFLLPGIFFSLLAVFLLVSVLLFSVSTSRMLAMMIAILPAFFFGWSIVSILAIAAAFSLLSRSLFVIRRDLTEHLTVRFFSSARIGTFMMSLGFSLAIVSAYANMISQLPSEKLLPKFSLAEGTGRIALQMAGKVNGSLKPLVEEDLSVDEFLLGLIPKEVAIETDTDTLSREEISLQDVAVTDALKSFGESNNIDYERLIEMSDGTNEEFQKMLFLEEGRRRMADILGRDVRGDERATNVLSEIINAKIFGTFSTAHTDGKYLNILRAVIVLLLFLSLSSLGSIFGLVWAFFARIVFWILWKGNIVMIRKIPVEAEQVVLAE